MTQSQTKEKSLTFHNCYFSPLSMESLLSDITAKTKGERIESDQYSHRRIHRPPSLPSFIDCSRIQLLPPSLQLPYPPRSHDDGLLWPPRVTRPISEWPPGPSRHVIILKEVAEGVTDNCTENLTLKRKCHALRRGECNLFRPTKIGLSFLPPNL